MLQGQLSFITSVCAARPWLGAAGTARTLSCRYAVKKRAKRDLIFPNGVFEYTAT